MAQSVRAFLTAKRDNFSRAALNVANVLKKDFTQIAFHIRNGEFVKASSLVEAVKGSQVITASASSFALSLETLRSRIYDLKQVGGPLFEIILGLTMVGGAAALLASAPTVTVLAAITVAAMMIVGILIALVGVDDGRKALEQRLY